MPNRGLWNLRCVVLGTGHLSLRSHTLNVALTSSLRQWCCRRCVGRINRVAAQLNLVVHDER